MIVETPADLFMRRQAVAAEVVVVGVKEDVVFAILFRKLAHASMEIPASSVTI